jgi:signal transduction histidine kinase/CheY-like chemotaxis protein
MVTDVLAFNELSAAAQAGERTRAIAAIGVATAALMATVGTLGLLLQWRVVRPVVRLARAAARIGKGRFDEPVPSVGHDEVATLSGEVDAMRCALRDRLQELEAARATIERDNAELARRVDERTRELKEANLAQARFLANMSHEIRTPMNAILGLAHLVERDTTDALQRERLAKLERAGRHLLQVINDILDLSKIEAGRIELADEDFEVEALLAGALDLVAVAARDKGLELILDTDHVPARLRGDPQRLTQAIANLLSNAVKFTERGWVCLRVELQAQEGDECVVRFEVQDTGPGLDAAQTARLFQPFAQGDPSTTRRHGGTGLGLVLTRHFAQRMGGDAGVDSRPGEGSRFWFSARLGSVGGAVPPRPAVKGLRALVVDDLPESLQVIAQRLEDLGLEVAASTRGDDAAALARVRRAAGQPFDVLLIDWRMAPLDGLQTLARLREAMEGTGPPALLFTAHDDPALAARAREAGFAGVLMKPVTPSSLLDALRRATRERAVAAPPAAPEGHDRVLRRRHAGRRVVVAEDNEINREIAQELLRHVGLVVLPAEDGDQAVRRVLDEAPDLVLMDMQMPVVDGLEATRRLRAAGATMPIIAMTANAFEQDRRRCLEAGMDDHLPKPVEPRALYLKLLEWLPIQGTSG